MRRYPLRKLAIAGDAKSPPWMLAKLARDEDAWVRGDAARDAVTPPETLATRDRAWGNICRSPAIWQITDDDEACVRGGVAWNPVTLLEDSGEEW